MASVQALKVELNEELLAEIGRLQAELTTRSSELMSMAQMAVDAEGRVTELQAELAALRRQLAVCQERREAELKQLDEVAFTATSQALEIGELRPWADVGKRAVRECWFRECTLSADSDSLIYMLSCCDVETIDVLPQHDPRCDIPALEAKLKQGEE